MSEIREVGSPKKINPFPESIPVKKSEGTENEIIRQAAQEAETEPEVEVEVRAEDLEEILPRVAKAESKEKPIVETVESKTLNFATMTEADIAKYASILARPFSIPDVLKVDAKDPNYTLRWVMRRGQDGTRILQMRAMGFTLAQPEDVKGGIDEALVTASDEGFIYQDVVLMKIQKERYYGYLASNLIKSNQAVGRVGVHNAAKAEAKRQLTEDMGGNINPLRGKVGFFTPQFGEL